MDESADCCSIPRIPHPPSSSPHFLLLLILGMLVLARLSSTLRFLSSTEVPFHVMMRNHSLKHIRLLILLHLPRHLLTWAVKSTRRV
jgi:hypothetical protein